MTLTLDANIDATTRRLRVTGSITGIQPGYAFRLDDELLTLQGFISDGGRYQDPHGWYVNRGVDGSTAASHTAGADVLGAVDAFASSDSGTTPPSPFASSGGGGSISVTDGETTVDPATSISLTGATVTDEGGGVAGLAVTGAVPVSLPDGQGLLAWSHDPISCTTDETMVPGFIYFIKVSVLVGATLAKIVVEQGDHDGITPTDCYAGLYDTAGNRLAVTADLASVWTTTTEHISPFAAPVVASAPHLYVALLVGGSLPSDTPGFVSSQGPGAQGQPNLANFGVEAGLPRFAFSAEGSHTTLPATYDLGTLDMAAVLGENMPWVGLK